MIRPMLLATAGLAVPMFVASAQIDIRITEVPYRETYAFFAVMLETGGSQPVLRMSDMVELPANQTGIGLRMQSAKARSIQFEIEMAYRKLDLAGTGAPDMSIGSVHLGGRLYPRTPQFGLGRNIGVRVMGAAAGGYAFDFADTTYDGGNAAGLDIRLSAGLAFSGRSDPSGLTAEVVYRPSKLSGLRYSVQPSWALRFGFLFGPD